MSEDSPTIPNSEDLRMKAIVLIHERGINDPEAAAAYGDLCAFLEQFVMNARDQQELELTKAALLIETGINLP